MNKVQEEVVFKLSNKYDKLDELVAAYQEHQQRSEEYNEGLLDGVEFVKDFYKKNVR